MLNFLNPGSNVIKLFLFVADAPDKKAGEYVPGKGFQLSLIFARKTEPC
jgi:hypothetical protein